MKSIENDLNSPFEAKFFPLHLALLTVGDKHDAVGLLDDCIEGTVPIYDLYGGWKL